jgi:signal transduction histidine kinase
MGVALVVSFALVVITARLHASSRELVAAVESVRLTHQATIELLLHARTDDPLLQREVEAVLLRRLGGIEKFVTSDAEARLLATARERTRAYLDDPASVDRHAAAYASLTALVDLNVRQARATYRAAARWDEVADILGIAAASLVVLVTIGVVWWLRARTFRPMLRLSEAMSRFGRGDHGARAAEEGAGELREMAAQFNELAGALDTRRAAEMAFLGGVAHDLRNPLGAMRLTVETLRIGEGDLPRERLERAVVRVHRHLAKIERMVDDFLDVARIEARQLHLQRSRCDVRAIVSDAVAALDGRRTAHPIRVELPPSPLPTSGDPMRLEQAFGNLIGNAIKYSPEGSSVEVRAWAGEGDVVVEVADHGVGMSEEDRRLLFEPFRRAPSVEGVPGLGLGLYMTRGIVEAHGGAIEVESALGSGSRFRVRLPSVA